MAKFILNRQPLPWAPVDKPIAGRTIEAYSKPVVFAFKRQPGLTTQDNGSAIATGADILDQNARYYPPAGAALVSDAPAQSAGSQGNTGLILLAVAVGLFFILKKRRS